MLKNNIYGFLSHVIFGIIFFIITSQFQSSLYPAGIMSLLMLLGYFLIGTRFQIQDSVKNNIFSVSAIAIIGLILWVIGVIWPSITTKGIFMFFYIHIFSITILLPKFIANIVTENFLSLIIIAIIPSLLMWLGLEYKRNMPAKNEGKI